MFIIPNNDITKHIDYGHRFMLTDNEIHPKVYEATKLMDTFPIGNIKVVLAQSHYNSHTDFCGKDPNIFKDNNVHMICDYTKSSLPLIVEEPTAVGWTLSDVNDKLYVNGQPQRITAMPNVEIENVINCEWHIFVDGFEYSVEDLKDYFKIDTSTTNTLIIQAINKVMVKYIVKIAIYDANKTYYDSVEMEVAI